MTLLVIQTVWLIIPALCVQRRCYSGAIVGHYTFICKAKKKWLLTLLALEQRPSSFLESAQVSLSFQSVYYSLQQILICFKMKTKTKSLLSQISRKFCESTSLHGYSYIANTNSINTKIIWSVVILCLSAIGVKFLVVNTHEYMESRLVTSIESSSASLKVSWGSK